MLLCLDVPTFVTFIKRLRLDLKVKGHISARDQGLGWPVSPHMSMWHVIYRSTCVMQIGVIQKLSLLQAGRGVKCIILK